MTAQARARTDEKHTVAAASKGGPVVFSLVNNAVLHDVRVMKEAHGLNAAGYRVRLFGRLLPDQAERLEVEGMPVRRLTCFDPNNDLSPEHERTTLELFGPVAPLLRKKLGALRAAQAQRKTDQATYENAVEAVKANTDRSERAVLNSVKEAARLRYVAGLEREREVYREESFFLNYFIYAARFLALDHDERPDVIHAHDLHPLAGAVGLAARTGARVVFDAHEIETERAPPLSPDRKQFIDAMERHLLAQVDHIIVCCESAADFYGKRYPGERPTVVMNAPRLDEGRGMTGTDVREMAGVSKETRLVVYTGGVGLEPRGVDKIVLAVALLPEVHMAIVGPRKAAHDDWLKEVVAGTGAADRIHFLNPVPSEALVATIQSGDVGVCAFQDVTLNHRYALPNKVFEMAFAGLPLVVPNFPDMGRFVTGLEIGVTMDESDPVSIAAALRRVLFEPWRFRPDAGKMTRLTEQYAWPVQNARFIEAYSAMFDRPRRLGATPGAHGGDGLLSRLWRGLTGAQ
jgi:glycosyltransferase involved in cell wall biosynthesis